MIIEYSPDLKTQTFSEDSAWLGNLGVRNGSEGNIILGVVNEPVAALDKYSLEQLPHGKLIMELFVNPGVRNISVYDGTPNEWFKQFDGTWPATIDTMAHLRGQRKSKTLSQVKKILDFACGNGMAGVYALHRNPNIEEIDFSDINHGHVKSALQNTFQYANEKRLTPDLAGIVSDGFSAMPSRKYDVIVASAVPATSAYDGLQRPLNSLFEGTGLLEKLLRDAPTFLNEDGRLILSHSSCGEQAFSEYAKKYGANVDEVLDQRENVFRVEFLKDQKWVDYLVEQGGLVKKDTPNPYWHTVKVKEISYQ